MTPGVIAGQKSAVALLRRWAQVQDTPAELCDFCKSTLEPVHRHLLEIAIRRIVCSCSSCSLRFEGAIGRWKLIPRDPKPLPGFALTDAEWDEFALPINLAFFFRSTPGRKMIAMYPSPAGATECLLPLARWDNLVSANPSLLRMEPDVEALLINRMGSAREYYIAPIDRCFELVGTIRMHWRGFSGGERVWKEIAQFFEKLRGQATIPTNGSYSQKETKKTKPEESGPSPSPLLEERVGESPSPQSERQELGESAPGSTEATHA
jgi:Family of unknown function (DUF5947)